MFKIEKNIPLQKREPGKIFDDRLPIEFLLSLEIDDSFFVPKKEYEKLSNLRSSIGYRSKRINKLHNLVYNFYVNEVDGGYRVWRTV